MIVCHCNEISSGEIRCAVKCMLEACPRRELCPESVYTELGKCPNCCGCFALAEEVIREAELLFVPVDTLRAPAAPAPSG